MKEERFEKVIEYNLDSFSILILLSGIFSLGISLGIVLASEYTLKQNNVAMFLFAMVGVLMLLVGYFFSREVHWREIK